MTMTKDKLALALKGNECGMNRAMLGEIHHFPGARLPGTAPVELVHSERRPQPALVADQVDFDDVPAMAFAVSTCGASTPAKRHSTAEV